jgi:hypothetical protein
MKTFSFAVIAVLLLAAPGRAEDAAAAKEEIIIGGAPPAAASSSCVDVQIGAARSFDCLNRRLRREVNKIEPRLPAPPVDARSSDLKTGVVNIPAIQQQYGRNFGVSVLPYRDPIVPAPPALRR